MRRAIVLSAFSTVALMMAAHATGIRPNFSSSAPIGLWQERPLPAKLHHGMMVGICPPPTIPVVRLFSSDGTLPYGVCPESNVALLLKPISALPGDVVEITHGMPVKVNGTEITNTIASKTIPAWPDGEYKVQPGEVWVFSSYSDKSFDSRYFGPVSINLVKVEAVPLLVN